MSSSRISSGDSLRIESRKPKRSLVVLDAVLRDDFDDDNLEEMGEPRDIVARAEARAKQEKGKIGGKKSSKIIGSKREYAQALHRRADLLHHKGDYEAALVLYHRAANICPRESSHGVAARRTAAAISSATNPSKALKKLLPLAKNSAQLVANFCPETAAKRAQKIVEESTDPVSAIDQILKYFDSRKDFWRDSPISLDPRRSTLISRSKIKLRQLGNLASMALENLQVAFASEDVASSLRIGNELLAIAEPLPDHFRYEVAARHYLAMTHVTLGRHDRAVDQASLIIRSAKKSGDATLRSRSLMTLGRVHLTFRHLDAAARAWEGLIKDVEDAVPRSWLLHEIGRCYFEMKRYEKALETSERCLEYAEEGNSRKWLMHGKLLNGQALVELGRLGEAVGVLQAARRIAEDEEDIETREYISELIDRLTETLRKALCFDEVSDANDRDAARLERKARTAKSEDGLKFRKSNELKAFKFVRGNTLSRLDLSMKSKIAKPGGRKIDTKDTNRKNTTIARKQTRRRNIPKIERSKISILLREGLERFDNEILDNNEKIESSEDSDKTSDELLTSRTRVVRKEWEENLIDEYFLDEEKLLSDKTREETCGLEGLFKFVGIEDDSREFRNDENFDTRRSGSSSLSEISDKVSYLKESEVVECSREERIDHSGLLSVRAGSLNEEIKDAKEDEEAQFFSSNPREISPESESSESVATTGKTYFVGKRNGTMEGTRNQDDFEETMRISNCSAYYYSGNIPSRSCEIDPKFTNDIVVKIDETPVNEAMFSRTINSVNVTNLEARKSGREIGDKFDNSTSPRLSSFIDDGTIERVSREILDVVSPTSYLTTDGSISAAVSHGRVASSGQNLLHRHSVPTSMEKEFQSRLLQSRIVFDFDST